MTLDQNFPIDIMYITEDGEERPTMMDPVSIGVYKCLHCGELLAPPYLDGDHFMRNEDLPEWPSEDDPWWTSVERYRQSLEHRQTQLLRLQGLGAPEIIMANQRELVSVAEEKLGMPISYPEDLKRYRDRQGKGLTG